MLPSTASPLEVIWVMGAGLAVFVGLSTLIDAIISLRWVITTQDDNPTFDYSSAHLVAWTHIVTHSSHALIEIAFMSFGIFAATQPATNPDRPITPVGLYFTVMLLFVQGVLIFLSLWLLWRREALIDRVKEIAAYGSGAVTGKQAAAAASVAAATAELAEAAAATAELAEAAAAGAEQS